MSPILLRGGCERHAIFNVNLTQAQLAEEAGVSKRTVERIEAGQSTDFVLLVRILRVLKLADAFGNLIPDLPQSPIALLKTRGRERKRVGHPRSNAKQAAAPGKPSAWKWGE